MTPCVCETDEVPQECGAQSPEAAEQELMGEVFQPWGRCTRGLGHEGDHVRCGGRGPHEMERWPQVGAPGSR